MSKSKAPKDGALSDNDRVVLARLEHTVEAVIPHVHGMIEAGKALAEIKSRQLYREGYPTWSEYTESRFRMTARRADQLIEFAGATAVVEAVARESGTAVPLLSERALRPLAALPTEDAVAAIREAAATEEGINPATLKAAAGRRRKAKSVKAPRPIRLRLPGGSVVVEINAKGASSGVTAESLLQAAIEAVRRSAADRAA